METRKNYNLIRINSFLSNKENNLMIGIINENEVRLISICPMCGASVVIKVSMSLLMVIIRAILYDGINANTLPFLSPEEREMLVSGICESCFDKLYK